MLDEALERNQGPQIWHIKLLQLIQTDFKSGIFQPHINITLIICQFLNQETEALKR